MIAIDFLMHFQPHPTQLVTATPGIDAIIVGVYHVKDLIYAARAACLSRPRATSRRGQGLTARRISSSGCASPEVIATIDSRSGTEQTIGALPSSQRKVTAKIL
jgi:hypothetical protein